MNSSDKTPLPQIYNAHGLLHISGLGWTPFAHHYSGNRFFFLFLGVLRCFNSPGLPLLPMYSAIDILLSNRIGFPIQKSPDQSLFGGSPKLIAAYHVFHRLPIPRHPPLALSSLTIKIASLRHHYPYSLVKEHVKNKSLWKSVKLYVVEVNGFEPMTSCVQSRRSPTELHPRLRCPLLAIHYLAILHCEAKANNKQRKNGGPKWI